MTAKNFTTIFCLLLFPFLSIASDRDEIIPAANTSTDTISSSINVFERTGMGRQMLQALDDAKKTFRYNGKGIIITKTNSSNAFKYIAELEVFLKNKGYDLLAHGGVSMPMKGFKIVKHVNCVEIIIGTI